MIHREDILLRSGVAVTSCWPDWPRPLMRCPSEERK